jgi:hypothetical protein
MTRALCSVKMRELALATFHPKKIRGPVRTGGVIEGDLVTVMMGAARVTGGGSIQLAVWVN